MAKASNSSSVTSSKSLVVTFDDFEKQLTDELETISWSQCLHTSASLGSLPSVRDALKGDPRSVDSVNRGMWTPLMYAVYYGQDSVADFLISAGADINVKNRKGQTALMLAAMCGHLNLVKQLLKKGAVLDAVDKTGMNALFHAARTGYDCVVQHLLDVGSDLNCVTFVDRLSPLLLSAAEGREALFQLFLKKGADVNHKMRSGHTARSLAAAGHHTRIVNIIDGHLSRINSVFSLFGGASGDSRTTKASAIYPVINQSENSADKKPNSKPKDLCSLLESLGLAKYYPVFKAQDIDLSIFMTMNDADLQEIGITLYGPRVKLRCAIEQLRKD